MRYSGENPVIEFFYDRYHDIRNFFWKIVRFCQWFPVLWQDRDWDWGFILSILEYKLLRMQRNFQSSHYVNHEKDIAQIQVARALIKRINADDYYSVKLDALEREFKTTRRFGFEDAGGGYSTMKHYYYPEPEPGMEKFLDKFWDAAHVDAEKQSQYEIKYLFQYLGKHLSHWWD